MSPTARAVLDANATRLVVAWTQVARAVVDAHQRLQRDGYSIDTRSSPGGFSLTTNGPASLPLWRIGTTLVSEAFVLIPLYQNDALFPHELLTELFSEAASISDQLEILHTTRSRSASNSPFDLRVSLRFLGVAQGGLWSLIDRFTPVFGKVVVKFQPDLLMYSAARDLAPSALDLAWQRIATATRAAHLSLALLTHGAPAGSHRTGGRP